MPIDSADVIINKSKVDNLLDLLPAYLGDGQSAYASGIVTRWPVRNQVRFCTPLFTKEQLEQVSIAERERLKQRLLSLAARRDSDDPHARTLYWVVSSLLNRE